jgi:hypothetical protein
VQTSVVYQEDITDDLHFRNGQLMYPCAIDPIYKYLDSHWSRLTAQKFVFEDEDENEDEDEIEGETPEDRRARLRGEDEPRMNFVCIDLPKKVIS